MYYLKNILKLSACLALGALMLSASGCMKHNVSTESTDQRPSPTAEIPTPAPTENNLPVVTMTVKDYGTIKIELYPEDAPNTVNNFISLVQSGFYDGLTFHRVVNGFMIQGGDPDGNGTGGPGYTIRGEFSDNGVKNPQKHVRGEISMARTQAPDSAGSQFFIMHQTASSLDGQYAAFGKVIEGMEVVDAIAKTELLSRETPKNPPVIEEVTVDTKGIQYPEPEKI